MIVPILQPDAAEAARPLLRATYGSELPTPSLGRSTGAAAAWDGFAWREGERTTGYGVSFAEPWMQAAGLRRLELLTAPRERGSGIGTALLERLTDECRAAGAARQDMRVREDQEQGRRFAARHGFVETERVRELELRLDAPETSAVAARLEGAARSLERGGIRLASYRQLRMERDDAGAQVHALWCETVPDQPAYDAGNLPPRSTFVEWLNRLTGNLDACYLALDGDEVVGISMAQGRSHMPDAALQNFTATLRPYRRRGISLALKGKVIAAARAAGFRRLITENDPRNTPMLGANLRAGFRGGRAWETWERRL